MNGALFGGSKAGNIECPLVAKQQQHHQTFNNHSTVAGKFPVCAQHTQRYRRLPKRNLYTHVPAAIRSGTVNQGWSGGSSPLVRAWCRRASLLWKGKDLLAQCLLQFRPWNIQQNYSRARLVFALYRRVVFKSTYSIAHETICDWNFLIKIEHDSNCSVRSSSCRSWGECGRNIKVKWSPCRSRMVHAPLRIDSNSGPSVRNSARMDNFWEDDVSVQEMELLEPNYEVFMKWAQPTTIWDTLISNRIRMATVRWESDSITN